jgi:hypothetical protein
MNVGKHRRLDIKAAIRRPIRGRCLSAFGYETEEDAIALANDSNYGLSGHVQSEDLERARRVAARLRAGTVHLNGAGPDFAAPFGGCAGVRRALYDKISREDILAHAYAQCRSNKGAPGVDGRDFADIEAYGVQRWLGELALALKQETYRPEPIRRVFIPKANGRLTTNAAGDWPR